MMKGANILYLGYPLQNHVANGIWHVPPKSQTTHQGLLKQLGLPQVPLAINFIVQVIQNWDVPPKPLVNIHSQSCFDICQNDVKSVSFEQFLKRILIYFVAMPRSPTRNVGRTTPQTHGFNVTAGPPNRGDQWHRERNETCHPRRASPVPVSQLGVQLKFLINLNQSITLVIIFNKIGYLRI